MCGIAGIWGPTAATEPLLRSLALMRHRGPDDTGHVLDGEVALGMCRLSIIDRAGGKQPLFSEDGRVAVVCNGEIYNHQPLATDLRARGHAIRSRVDTEVLPHLYEEHGMALFTHLRGMFAVAIWDRRQRRLVLARDRFGKKPLYYARTPDGGLAFASELKGLRPLATGAGLELRVRDGAIYDYLSLGVVPQPDTIYSDVFALPSGSWLEFDGRNVRIERYWELPLAPKRDVSFEAATDRVRELVADAVRVRLEADVPLGLFLSSGLDSTVVAYEAAKVLGGRLRTFTVSVPDRELDEADVAARTARALGVQHEILPLDLAPLELVQQVAGTFDQPFADPSALPTLAIARLARQHVTVVLNGDGGDEVFAGYRRHLAARAWGHAEHLRPPSWARPRSLERRVGSLATVLSGRPRRSALGLALRFARALGLSPAERYLAWTTDLLRESDKAFWRRARLTPTEERVAAALGEGGTALDRQLRGDVRLNLLSDLLVKMDMATMANSVEARSPLLDHVLAEYVACLPDSHKVRGTTLKAVLRSAYGGVLPAEVIAGPKRGFEVPLATWLDGPLRSLLHDTVGARDARLLEFLEPTFVADVLLGVALQERNRPALLYALVVLELWLRADSTRSGNA